MWLSLQGFPQEIIIDVSELKNYPKEKFNSFGIFCCLGAKSNPKLIELQVSENYSSNTEENIFFKLTNFELEMKSGYQIFPLNIKKSNGEILCKEKMKFLKIIIKSNYGDDITYINQIMLFEENAEEAAKYFSQEKKMKRT